MRFELLQGHKNENGLQLATHSVLVARRCQKLNPKGINDNFDSDYLWQIYEELKQLSNLKDLIAPLEARRIREQQEQTGCATRQ